MLGQLRSLTLEKVRRTDSEDKSQPSSCPSWGRANIQTREFRGLPVYCPFSMRPALSSTLKSLPNPKVASNLRKCCVRGEKGLTRSQLHLLCSRQGQPMGRTYNGGLKLPWCSSDSPYSFPPPQTDSGSGCRLIAFPLTL